jgi:hypothetical protein
MVGNSEVTPFWSYFLVSGDPPAICENGINKGASLRVADPKPSEKTLIPPEELPLDPHCSPATQG